MSEGRAVRAVTGRFGIGARLALATGALLGVAVAALLGASLGIVELRDAHRRTADGEFRLLATLLDAGNRLHGIRASLIGLASDARAHAQGRSELHAETAALDELLAALHAQMPRGAANGGRLERLTTLFRRFVHTRDAEILPAVDAGRHGHALALALGVQAQRYLAMRSILRELEYTLRERAVLAAVRSDAQARRVVLEVALAGVLMLVVGVALVAHHEHRIARPLRAVAGLAREIAAGDLTVTVPARRHDDEVGDLLASFADMVARLRAVHAGLREGVTVLGTAAADIDAAASRASGAAAETAAALAQTASSAQRMRELAEQGRTRAQRAAGDADALQAVSVQGRRAVDTVLEEMHAVHSQMHELAATVAELTARAEAIGGVVVDIRALAQQSNVLAVNAAMTDAADDGPDRGFGAVSREIRRLATDTREAAARVRASLEAVHHAVAGALATAERADRSATSGFAQARDAGKVIARLAAGVEHAAQATRELAHSGQRQSGSIDEVARATAQIRDASARHEHSAHQTAGAARHIAGLSERLRALTEQMRS